ncbi:MAG TPA: hypothetical protein VJ941_03310 [Gracilimonas sp.]|nr:hypothetical protein [Gracilimonas sp.]
MRLKRTYLFVFSLLFWLGNFAQSGYTQPTIGVVWDIPDNSRITDQQLQLFEELGVTHLEIQHPVSDSQLSKLNDRGFSLLIRSDVEYYTVSTLNESFESYRDYMAQLISDYAPLTRVAGIGLISQSHFKDPEFTSAFSDISAELLSQTNKTLYYFLNNEWYSVNSPDLSFGILLTDKDYQEHELADFDRQFNTFVESEREVIVFFHSGWLTEAVSEFPEFQTSLNVYEQNGTWSLPLPHLKSTISQANWLVFALVFLWIILAIQVKFIPNARSMIMRFYFAHRFYVDDILHYRERYATQSIVMMVLHALTGGIVVYILAIQLLNDSGINALYHHLSWLEVFGSGYYSISFLAIITLLILQAVSIFWLYLPAKNLEHVSQTANLYAGLLYTDYIVLTLLVSFYLTSFSTVLVYILVTFYVLIGFINFYLTAFNTARNIGAEKLIYFTITVLLHTVVCISVLVYILTQTQIIDILSLSISLK